ncbi:MAG: pyridoxal-phosphate dependent enzyme [Melioribacteraceae bacterium]|nr:pyridoxal-phosphate dependent enzyme [Melioribacteraceae bacterium]
MHLPGKLKLANLPTPVQHVSFNGSGFLIKRDDYTGVELTGNKIRKLEYLLFEAVRKKAEYIFTCGGDQSNHCRATAFAAAKTGMKSRLYLWGRQYKQTQGNLLLDKIVGSEMKFLCKKEYKNVHEIMKSDAAAFCRKNRNVYIVPTGGSDKLGIWGYINFINELKQQVEINKIKAILCANGSGGTVAGMILGTALFGLNIKIFGVNVISGKYEMTNAIRSIIDDCIHEYKLDINVTLDNMELLDGFSNEGYKNILPEKIELIKEFARQTGIMLDPTYTGKAFYAYNENFLKGRKKNNILFLHTGGIFGVFPRADKFLLN